MAIVTVTSATEAALQQAITQAGNGGTVEFASDVIAIDFTTPLVISSNVTIDGDGVGIVDFNGAVVVASGATVASYGSRYNSESSGTDGVSAFPGEAGDNGVPSGVPNTQGGPGGNGTSGSSGTNATAGGTDT